MICPIMQKECLQKECSKWVVLYIGSEGEKVETGKCSDAWIPLMLIELRLSIDKLLQAQVKTLCQ